MTTQCAVQDATRWNNLSHTRLWLSNEAYQVPVVPGSEPNTRLLCLPSRDVTRLHTKLLVVQAHFQAVIIRIVNYKQNYF